MAGLIRAARAPQVRTTRAARAIPALLEVCAMAALRPLIRHNALQATTVNHKLLIFVMLGHTVQQQISLWALAQDSAMQAHTASYQQYAQLPVVMASAQPDIGEWRVQHQRHVAVSVLQVTTVPSLQ